MSSVIRHPPPVLRPPSSPLRLIFMGTPAFAVPSLKALHEAGHDIVAVYTQPPRPAGRGQKDTPSPVQLYAEAHGLPVYYPVSLKTPETQAQFAAHQADAAIVVAYGLLLPKPILDATRMGCINVHPSLLPRWRGAAPMQRTILAGDRETAIVIIQMDEGLDTGDMLHIEPYAIAPGTTSGMLHDALSEAAGPLLVQTLQRLHEGAIIPIKQSAEGVTYAKKIAKGEAHIDWSQPGERIYQQILGLNPFPGAYFTYMQEPIKIWNADFTTATVEKLAGTVLDNHLAIACQGGILHPTLLQRPGKKRMHTDELLRGFPIPQGTELG